MKISIAISVLILAAAALIGWGDHHTLAEARAERSKLTAEAALLGILSLDPDHPEKGLRITKRGRTDKEALAHQAARDIIALAKELEALKESGDEPDEAMQMRILEFIDRMLSLDADQLKTLIADFRASTEVGDEMRSGMISFAIMTLANEHPEAALKLLTESDGLADKGMMGSHLLTNSLSKWASTDPAGALVWLRENRLKNPEMDTDRVKVGLLQGAASYSISAGFDMLRELKFKDTNEAIGELAGSADTPAKRTEFLDHYRTYLKGSPQADGDPSRAALSALSEGIAKDGFGKGSSWITENKLSEKEITALAGNVALQSASSEKGQWIAWMGESLPGEAKDNEIGIVMENWTRTDYRAAGEWLAAAPESPSKAASVSSYARTVAHYDPQTAEQWALTLPAGERRQETLRAIHTSWPQDTEESKALRAAFSERYGIR